MPSHVRCKVLRTHGVYNAGEEICLSFADYAREMKKRDPPISPLAQEDDEAKAVVAEVAGSVEATAARAAEAAEAAKKAADEAEDAAKKAAGTSSAAAKASGKKKRGKKPAKPKAGPDLETHNREEGPSGS